MLSESSFVINHWITILWIIVAGLYTLFAVGHDLANAKKSENKAGAVPDPL